MPITRNCLWCEKEFKTEQWVINRGRGKFCSCQCANHYHYPTYNQLTQCLWCNKSFHPRPNRLKKGQDKFCSNHCARKYRYKFNLVIKPSKKTLHLKCPFCNKDFAVFPSHIKSKVRERCCSMKCAMQYRYINHEYTPKGYKSLGLPNHPLADKNGKVSEHRMILFAKIGDGEHPCHWCGEMVKWIKANRGNANRKFSLLADHVDGNSRNNEPDNLVPSCMKCNKERDNLLIVKDDEPHVINPNGHKQRAVERICKHCKKPFLTPPSKLLSNRGNFCSQSCARTGQKKRTKTNLTPSLLPLE